MILQLQVISECRRFELYLDILRSNLMYILGTELAASFDPCHRTVDTSESPSTQASYPTISLSDEAASFASRNSSGCMQSSIPSRPKSSISKLQAHRLFDYFDYMNIETPSRVSSLSGKHSSIRAATSEPQGDEVSRRELFSTSDTSLGDLLLLDVCPLGLGIEDSHGHMCTLIRRNTTIPTRTQLTPIFTNAYAYQTTATIRIFEGEHNLTKYNVHNLLTPKILFASLLYCRHCWANLVFRT